MRSSSCISVRTTCPVSDNKLSRLLPVWHLYAVLCYAVHLGCICIYVSHACIYQSKAHLTLTLTLTALPYLTWSAIGPLPDQIGSISSLVQLNLSSNNITGDSRATDGWCPVLVTDTMTAIVPML